MSQTVVKMEATGHEIEAVIRSMEPALEGKDANHVMMACLALALYIQEPDLTPEQVAEGVEGASQWISLFISSLGGHVGDVN